MNTFTFLHNYIDILITLHQKGLTYNLLINLIIFIYYYVIYRTTSIIKRRIKIFKLIELLCYVAMLFIEQNKK